MKPNINIKSLGLEKRKNSVIKFCEHYLSCNNSYIVLADLDSSKCSNMFLLRKNCFNLNIKLHFITKSMAYNIFNNTINSEIKKFKNVILITVAQLNQCNDMLDLLKKSGIYLKYIFVGRKNDHNMIISIKNSLFNYFLNLKNKNEVYLSFALFLKTAIITLCKGMMLPLILLILILQQIKNHESR